MAGQPPPQPSPALTEILKQTGELDRILDGRGLTFESTPAPPAVTPPQPLYIPAADWDEEERERQALEQQRQDEERARILEDELARIADDAEPPETLPAKKRRWRP